MYKETLRTVISSIWPSLLILITILFSIRYFSITSNNKKIVFYREILYLIFVVYLLCFFYVLTFEDVDWSTANFIPFKEMFRYKVGSRMFLKNVCGNIILFIPYGFFVAYFTQIKKVKTITVLSLLVSLAVETIQYRIGRVFDIDDIFLNIIGGILGYYFYRLLTFLLNKTSLKKYKETLCNVGMILIMIIVLIYMGV